MLPGKVSQPDGDEERGEPRSSALELAHASSQSYKDSSCLSPECLLLCLQAYFPCATGRADLAQRLDSPQAGRRRLISRTAVK